MKRHEVNEIVEFVLQNHTDYQIRLASMEIVAFNFHKVYGATWYANFAFYECDDDLTKYKHFHCGNTQDTQDVLIVKQKFLDFCKNFHRQKCECCGQYLDL